jgi:hypothetical protein
MESSNSTQVAASSEQVRMPLLCRLGWHRWGTWIDLSITYKNAQTDVVVDRAVRQQKRCKLCNRMQEVTT